MATPGLLVEQVAKVNDIEAPTAGATADAVVGNGAGQVRFSCARAPDEHDILAFLQKGTLMQAPDQVLVNRTFLEVEIRQFLCHRQFCRLQAIPDRNCFALQRF